MNQMKHKLLESTSSILPIAIIIVLLSATLTPLSSGTMLLFLIGAVFLVFGLSLFTLGAEMSMQPLGSKVGSAMVSTKKVWLITFISFIIGIMVTVSEPDLLILAHQVPQIDQTTLILTISIGVGVFLTIGVLRIMFGISLNILLIIFYLSTFIITFFLPDAFKPLAFDSGGVTTGPMTVPFIMSIGAGVSAASASKAGNRADSFGLTALASVGPIIAMLILGIISGIEGGSYTPESGVIIGNSQEGFLAYLEGLGQYLPEVLISLSPIVIFTLLFQLVARAFGKKQFIRIWIGFAFAAVGLSVFLTGANVGFLPTGTEIGISLAGLFGGIALLPVVMVLGFFIVKAEPAVYVLNKQVEKMSAGAISGKTTGLGLSLGVSAALGLSALRILTGIPIMYILIPGYAIAIGLTFFVPKMFVGIAFDSGGVASGTMMSGFVLPLAVGACSTLGGDVMSDAFGCVAFVAMAPIIAIEICGLVYNIKSKRNAKRFVTVNESFIEYDVRPRARKGAKSGTEETDTQG